MIIRHYIDRLIRNVFKRIAYRYRRRSHPWIRYYIRSYQFPIFGNVITSRSVRHPFNHRVNNLSTGSGITRQRVKGTFPEVFIISTRRRPFAPHKLRHFHRCGSVYGLIQCQENVRTAPGFHSRVKIIVGNTRSARATCSRRLTHHVMPQLIYCEVYRL
jgi:hypothetical protein